jgi:hypothetical protein
MLLPLPQQLHNNTQQHCQDCSTWPTKATATHAQAAAEGVTLSSMLRSDTCNRTGCLASQAAVRLGQKAEQRHARDVSALYSRRLARCQCAAYAMQHQK